MVESILRLFISEQRAEILVSNPMIEFIFMVLFVTFVLALFIHLTLFNKFKKIRHYLSDTNRMDIEPLHTFKEEFDKRLLTKSITTETFVQEKFSEWRMLNVPVISLIKMVQMTVSIFILLGVLGTFIGLTISLGSIDATGSQLVENVVGVLAGIDMAFYTSIVGMGLSLMMTVLIKVLNTEFLLTDIMLKVESRLEGNEEDSIGRLIEVSETINLSILDLQETNQQSLGEIVAAFAGFQEYTTGLQKSAEDLAQFNDGLSENLQDFQILFQSMSDVTDGFSEETTRLNNNFDSLFSYFKKMDGRNEQLAKRFEHIYEKVKEVAVTQIDTLHEFENSVVELKDFISSILREQDNMQGSFQKVLQKSDDLVVKMSDHQQEFKQVFGDDLSSQLSGIMSYLGELAKDFDQLGGSIVKLPQALDVINKTQAEYKHLLSDRFDELKEFNRSFSNHLKAHASESAMFERNMLEATKTYEQVGLKNNQLINDINTAISQMDHTFNRQENQLKANVDLLKDTLTKYVTGLEGTFGDKLHQVMQTIANSVDGTNNGIKMEFQELRRLSEDIQQNNAYVTQNILRELGQEIQTLNRLLSTFGQQAVQRNREIRLGQHEY